MALDLDRGHGLHFTVGWAVSRIHEFSASRIHDEKLQEIEEEEQEFESEVRNNAISESVVGLLGLDDFDVIDDLIRFVIPLLIQPFNAPFGTSKWPSSTYRLSAEGSIAHTPLRSLLLSWYIVA